jgi:hypothetical protein
MLVMYSQRYVRKMASFDGRVQPLPKHPRPVCSHKQEEANKNAAIVTGVKGKGRNDEEVAA